MCGICFGCRMCVCNGGVSGCMIILVICVICWFGCCGWGFLCVCLCVIFNERLV